MFLLVLLGFFYVGTPLQMGNVKLGLILTQVFVIAGIPILAIDPKGDLGNMLLTFPELSEHDFAPWVDPEEAARKV